jgi:hypothetical protein
MAIVFSDLEIAELIQERKPLPTDYRKRLQTREKSGHKERELSVVGSNGHEFQIILRQSLFNPLDFSVILAYRPPEISQNFRLRRYNGKSHEHTNIIEELRFYDFHIHQATARYQEFGANEDSYAEPTATYANFDQAVSCLVRECGFEIPENPQFKLFEET